MAERMETLLADLAAVMGVPLVVNLGPVDRIPAGEGREFMVNGDLIAVFRTRGDGLFATQARCPHREGPLADGIIGGGSVICPLHALKFCLESGQPIGHDCVALRTYQVSLSDDREILLNV